MRLISYTQSLISEEHAGIREKIVDMINSCTDMVDEKISAIASRPASLSSYGKISDFLVGICVYFCSYLLFLTG